MENRTLFFGDNLDILREKFQDNCIDLIYLDPPFNSQRDYNILFKEGLVENNKAQIKAFEDSWSWTRETEKVFEELVTGNSKTEISSEISNLIQGFYKIIGNNNVMAYLVMMTIRLIELHRVLKPTGSLYLHCDPTASHYLKIILDVIFDKKNFVNEIIWKRSFAHSDTKQGAKHLGRLHDIIFFYTKTNKYKFNPQFMPHNKEYVEKFYKYLEPKTGRKYQLISLTGPGGKSKGNPFYEVMGVKRYWQFSRENMKRLIKEGRIIQTKPGNVPRFKKYLDEVKGVTLQDIWTDINPIASQSNERLGYPTQKPETLLERIIKTSSKKGDLILDPFCGCGTTISVAEQLERRWVGIDITTLAINLIINRLEKQFKFSQKRIKINIDGIPKDLRGATNLAERDRFEFQYWALSLVHAMPLRSRERMKGPDKGIDGTIVIRSSENEFERIIVEVKSGHVHRKDIASLKGDMKRENAIGGLFITLEEPTREMKREVNTEGFFKVGFTEYPKMQIITIKELLGGKKPDLPSIHKVYKEAEEKKVSKGKQRKLI